MGYYTNYSLDVFENELGNRPCHAISMLVAEEIKKMDIFSEDYLEEFGCDHVLNEYTKWYDWKNDMLLISSKFPSIIFCLHGEGDDATDLWNAYFQDGKCQICKAQIVYPEYEKGMMKKSIPRGEKYSYQT